MLHDSQNGSWLRQSAVTSIERASSVIDQLPSSVSDLRDVSQQLVAHYMGNSDGSTGPVTGERLKEVDMRYAEAMFLKLLEKGAPTLSRERPPEERIAGCCRDFAVLFVTMARHKQIPARVRAGYSTYFRPGWYIDHVIAEIWDAGAGRWRLIEPEVSEALANREGFDPLDVPSDKFVTGLKAWSAARSGEIDPERCVVAPDFLEPYTRSWLSLRHHIVQDLAALNKAEMLVWDQWGILNEDDPLAHAELLDRLAEETSTHNCDAEIISKWGQKEVLRVQAEVISYSPAYGSPLKVNVSKVLEGTLYS